MSEFVVECFAHYEFSLIPPSPTISVDIKASIGLIHMLFRPTCQLILPHTPASLQASSIANSCSS
jgi:hypothetical protein